MHLSASEVVGVLDRVGIVAFALSGVEVGARRRFDVFGLLVMGIVTGTGGGVMRDVVLGRLPLLFARPDYLAWAGASSIIAIILVWHRRTLPRGMLALADALGLGAFAAAGALAALHTGLSVAPVLIMAMVTATGGGVLRDLLADRVPLVLRSEVNATAAAAGGFCVWLSEPVSAGAAALLGVGVTALVRVGGLAFDLHLPRPGGSGPGQKRLL